jgi:NADH-quinone oxidoreductase subunit N
MNLSFCSTNGYLNDTIFSKIYNNSHKSFSEIREVLSVMVKPFCEFLPEITLLTLISFVLVGVGITLSRGQSKYALTNSCATLAPRIVFFVCILCMIQAFYIKEGALFDGYLFSGLGISLSKFIVALSSLYVVLISTQYVRQNARAQHLLEYFLLLLLSVILLFCVVGANNLFSLYLTIGGFSLNLYVLILFDINSRISREAALKYFVLSATSTGLIIFGTLLLYSVLKTAVFGEIS